MMGAAGLDAQILQGAINARSCVLRARSLGIFRDKHAPTSSLYRQCYRPIFEHISNHKYLDLVLPGTSFGPAYNEKSEGKRK
jgi:hypothetical protein